MTVIYEWDVEEVTSCESEQYEKGEVLDHWHQDSYAKCVKFVEQFICPVGIELKIVLVRTVVDKYTSVTDRAWAYLEDGKLPTEFEGGIYPATVPKRFHDEVEKES